MPCKRYSRGCASRWKRAYAIVGLRSDWRHGTTRGNAQKKTPRQPKLTGGTNYEKMNSVVKDSMIGNVFKEKTRLRKTNNGGVWASMSIHEAARTGNIKAVKRHLTAGTDVNAKDEYGRTPLDAARLLVVVVDGETPLDAAKRYSETADLLRKHGGKTGEELKAEGK